MLRWHVGTGWKDTENEKEIRAFIDDILKVCMTHNMSLTTLEESCNLLIKPYNDYYARDLECASIDFRIKK